jgi:hypothetical protein
MCERQLRLNLSALLRPMDIGGRGPHSSLIFHPYRMKSGVPCSSLVSLPYRMKSGVPCSSLVSLPYRMKMHCFRHPLQIIPKIRDWLQGSTRGLCLLWRRTMVR